ncbi:hypothetical protein BKA56DRAFT_64815 [Ilyonectria sp. MPI-CAGE-AT-0026]|nr:hypothetical protein BKA56DRAFT_64815 [Ilyonectria sp. MPI-CAGE-AT-0026]
MIIFVLCIVGRSSHDLFAYLGSIDPRSWPWMGYAARGETCKVLAASRVYSQVFSRRKGDQSFHFLTSMTLCDGSRALPELSPKKKIEIDKYFTVIYCTPWDNLGQHLPKTSL